LGEGQGEGLGRGSWILLFSPIAITGFATLKEEALRVAGKALTPTISQREGGVKSLFVSALFITDQ
jgi:hypothetical protein